MTEYPVISLGDLNFNYILDGTLSANPIHYIEIAYDMDQLTDQPTRVDDKTSPVFGVILTSHPALHRKSAVLKYTLSDHYFIYTHMEFEHTKPSVVDHNIVKFRDMKNFDMESFSNDPKKMWSEIKRLVPGKNKHSHITCDISANNFNNHFANIGNKMNSKFQNLDDHFFWKGPKSIHSFRFKRMSSAAIVTYLRSLPNRSNNDILGIEIIGPIYFYIIVNVIDKSLESGVFEQDWKNARVTPIYKDDGDINDDNNYRPICVIGHIAKMIESLVSYQIIDFLEEHSFISMDQSVYLKGHSTQTSLHRVLDDWPENVNDGATTGACLLDISKCFDSINHTILLKKLEMYGITCTELKWFPSDLRGRKQIVKFHQKTSEFCDITWGVPQGSVLGPILFLLFINDVSNFTVEGCVLNMYADDVIIYTSATSKDELEYRLQVCIDNIFNWYSMNKLCIDKKKPNVMVIGSKWQLKSLHLDDFTISVDSD